MSWWVSFEQREHKECLRRRAPEVLHLLSKRDEGTLRSSMFLSLAC